MLVARPLRLCSFLAIAMGLVTACTGSTEDAGGSGAAAVESPSPSAVPFATFRGNLVFDDTTTTAAVRIGSSATAGHFYFSIRETSKAGAATHQIDGSFDADATGAAGTYAKDGCRLAFTSTVAGVRVDGACSGIDYAGAYAKRTVDPLAGSFAATGTNGAKTTLDVASLDTLGADIVLTAHDSAGAAIGTITSTPFSQAAVVGAGTTLVYNALDQSCTLEFELVNPTYANGAIAKYTAVVVTQDAAHRCGGVSYAGTYNR